MYGPRLDKYSKVARYLKRNLEELSNSSDFLKFRPGRVLVSVLRRCETSSQPPAT
jgi:hypothetical protein